MKRLLLAPLILSLGLPAHAGIPSKFEGKWMKVDKNWTIDTEDVQIKNNRIRFWVDRQASPGEYAGSGRKTMTWKGKLRIDCKSFRWYTEKNLPGPYGAFAWHSTWNQITPGLQKDLANHLCFLTGVEGYTRESKEPVWIQKIIRTVQNN